MPLQDLWTVLIEEKKDDFSLCFSLPNGTYLLYTPCFPC